MAGQVFSRDMDLTGLWSGEYWYLAGGPPTPFTAHLIETDGALSGTTLEPPTFSSKGDDLSATLAGERGGSRVRFTKMYDPAPGVHQEPIYYSGSVDAALLVIEGDWHFAIRDAYRGRFILTRVSRGAEAVKQETADVVKVGR